MFFTVFSLSAYSAWFIKFKVKFFKLCIFCQASILHPFMNFSIDLFIHSSIQTFSIINILNQLCNLIICLLNISNNLKHILSCFLLFLEDYCFVSFELKLAHFSNLSQARSIAFFDIFHYFIVLNKLLFNTIPMFCNSFSNFLFLFFLLFIELNIQINIVIMVIIWVLLLLCHKFSASLFLMCLCPLFWWSLLSTRRNLLRSGNVLNCGSWRWKEFLLSFYAFTSFSDLLWLSPSGFWIILDKLRIA